MKTKEAEAKLAIFTGTLQQRLLQLATEVSLALPSTTRGGPCPYGAPELRSALLMHLPVGDS